MIRVKRLFKSFGYAFKGLFKTFNEEQNLRIQAVVGLLMIILGINFKISGLEWAVLVLAICLVLTAEITNSAVERVTDVLKPRINSYVKEIKDIMAAAVLLASIAAAAIGLIIFLPHVYKIFGQF
ncbi:MAG: diacylglycerol kinase [bacterium]|nr:diacylglycerol kinase [bacterium]